MNTTNIKVVEVTTPSLFKKFIELPYQIYRNYPCWIPPLISDMKEKLNKNKNPFFQYGRVKLFAALNKNGDMIGRIAAVINPLHNEIYKDRTGFFGLFESFDDIRIAQSLFHNVSAYLKENGFNKIIGPVNFTTNEECGILVKGFNDSAMIMCSYSPPYYDDLIKGCGFGKAVDLFSYEGYTEHIFPPKYFEVSRHIEINPLLSFRTFRKEFMYEDSMIMKDLYNQSFKKVWGFVPLSCGESMLMAETFTKFFDKELIWIAFYNNKPAGFVLALPDINQVLMKLKGKLFPFGFMKLLLNRKKINTLRVLVLCIIEEYRRFGIETSLIEKIRTRMRTGGYKKAELAVVIENNYSMRRLLEHMGFTKIKTYRVYETTL